MRPAACTSDACVHLGQVAVRQLLSQVYSLDQRALDHLAALHARCTVGRRLSHESDRLLEGVEALTQGVGLAAPIRSGRRGDLLPLGVNPAQANRVGVQTIVLGRHSCSTELSLCPRADL